MDPHMPILYINEEVEEARNYPSHGVNYRDMIAVIQPPTSRPIPKEDPFKPFVKQRGPTRNKYAPRGFRVVHKNGCAYKDSEFLAQLSHASEKQEAVTDESCDVKPSIGDLNFVSPALASVACYTNSNHYKRKEYLTCLTFLVDIYKDRMDKIAKECKKAEEEYNVAKTRADRYEQNVHMLPKRLWLRPEFGTKEDFRMIRFHEADIMSLQRVVHTADKKLKELESQEREAREKYMKAKKQYDLQFSSLRRKIR